MFIFIVSKKKDNDLYIPDSATSEIGTFCSKDMKPRIEKIANPATKLVPLFRKHKATQSLWIKKASKISEIERKLATLL